MLKELKIPNQSVYGKLSERIEGVISEYTDCNTSHSTKYVSRIVVYSQSRNSRNVCFSSFDEFHERDFHFKTARYMEKKGSKTNDEGWPKGTSDGAFKAAPRICLLAVLIRRTNNRRRPSNHERFEAVANDQFLAGNTCNCIRFTVPSHRSVWRKTNRCCFMPSAVMSQANVSCRVR